MTTRQTEIAAKIVEHIKTTGQCPTFKSVGTDYVEGQPVFDALFASGTLVKEIRVSPTGRKMKVVRVVR